MLGGFPLGTAPLGSAAVSRAVYMAATVSCSAVSTAGALRKRGMRASLASSCVASAKLIHGLKATRQASATASASLHVKRGVRAIAFGYSSGTMLARLRVEMSAFATATLTARLTPYTGIMLPDPAVMSCTATATLSRGRQMFASASSECVAADAPMFAIRGLGSVAGLSAKVNFYGEPDIWVGGLAGVRNAHLSSVQRMNCTPSVSLRPTRNVKATRQARCTATATIRRKRKMLTPVRIAKATIQRAALRASRFMSTVAMVASSSVTATMRPKRMMQIVARVSRALVTLANVIRKPSKMAATMETGATFTPATITRYRTMQGLAQSTATASAGIARRITLQPVLMRVRATVVDASLTSNPFDDEPGYRTIFVGRQSMSVVVQSQTFVISIGSDSKAMQTFTKQPGERLAYDIDLTEWFAELEGDDIEAASATVTSASTGVVSDLTIDPPYRIGTPCYRVKIWTEGGLNGATYQVRCTLDTEGGRRKEVDFKVKVKEY